MESKQNKKREEKAQRKKQEKEEKKEEVRAESSEEDNMDYSSNEEDQLEKKNSLQRVEPKIPKTFEEKQNWPRLIVILE